MKTYSYIGKRLIFAAICFIVAVIGFPSLVHAETTAEFPTAVTSQTTVPDGYTGIYNADDLSKMKDNKAGSYILMNDINLTGTTTYTSVSGFYGTFDGNGHTISGLTCPLFKEMTGGLVANLGLTDVNIQTTGEAGAVATSSKSSMKGSLTIRNVYVTGLVAGGGYVGGILGYIRQISDNYKVSISSCSNYAAVLSASYHAGGIVGSKKSGSLASLSNLTNYGVIRAAEGMAGGIAGDVGLEDESFYMSSSQNEGLVLGKGNIGGIIGKLTCKAYVDRCTGSFSGLKNTGTIKSTASYVGGIIGMCEVIDSVKNKDAKITISSCTNLGTIDGSYSTSGGIVGMVQHSFSATASGATTIQNCMVRCVMENGGSIVGKAYLAAGSLKIMKCVGIQLEKNGAAGIIEDSVSYNGMTSGYTSVSDCYYRSATASTAYMTGSKVYGTATALDDAQCKEQASYPGLSFPYLWKIASDKNDGYPYISNAEDLEAPKTEENVHSAEEQSAVADMLKRTNKTSEPFGEFDLPIYLCQDYDDSLGMKVNITAYISGKYFTEDDLWQDAYEDVLSDIFLQGNGLAQSVSEGVNLYADEVSAADDFLSLVSEELVKDNAALQVGGGVADILKYMAAADEDLLVDCITDMRYLTYIADNTSDNNLKKAANKIKNMRFSNTMDQLSSDIKGYAKTLGVSLAEKAIKTASQTAWKQAAAGASSVLSGALAAELIFDVKNLAYDLTGASKPIKAYFNVKATYTIRQEMYKYYATLLSTDKWVELEETFNALKSLTDEMYASAQTMLGGNYKSVLSSDKSYQKQVNALPKLTISNYTKKTYTLQEPGLSEKSVVLAQDEKLSIATTGCRYGVKITYKETKKSDAFSVTGKGVIKASKKKTGSGEITVKIQQNGKTYSDVLKVKVVTAEEKKKLEKDKNKDTSKNKDKLVDETSYSKPFGSKPFALTVNTASTGKITATSSNKKVASVTVSGKKITVKPKTYGKATVTIKVAKTKKSKAYTQQITIKVVPKKLAAPKIVSKKKHTMTVSWKRDKKASGYEIRYSTSKNFKKHTKTITLKKNKLTKQTIKKLTSKKTYYVQVRSYKKVGKTKLVGKWSKTVKVKCK